MLVIKMKGPDPVVGKAVTGKKIIKQKKNPWESREWGPKLSLPLISNRTEVSYQAVSFKPHASFQHRHMLFILPFKIFILPCLLIEYYLIIYYLWI